MEDLLQKGTDGLKHYEYGIKFGQMDNYNMPPSLEKEMQRLYNRLNKEQKNLPALTAEIKKAINKYPHVLPFQNYLYSAYMQAGDKERAYELNDKILAENPDYLFAVINKAAMYYMQKKYDKIPEVLGSMLEIGELFPQRKKFHVTEYLGFNKLVVLYACAVNNIELAKNRYELMEKIAPGMPDTEFAREVIEDKAGLYFDEENKTWDDFENYVEYNEIEADYVSLPQTTQEPAFYHPLVAQLYHFGLSIDAGLVNEILLLPRETLIQDLHEVILDSIRRFEFYNEKDWVEEESYSLIHAMVLLAELKAVDALPVLLEILRQGDDYLEYWFGDLLTEDIWDVYYQVFDLQAYLAYLREPRNNSYAKNMVADVIFRKIEAGELRQDEAIAIYQLLLQYVIDNRENADVLDTDFMGGIIADICKLRITSLLPIVKTCFEYNMVDEWICGPYSSIERDIHKPERRKKNKSKLATGFQSFYEDINRSIISYQESENERIKDEDVEFRFIEDKRPVPISLLPSKSIAGRNDSCPCGSGKKFKKCCMN